MAREAIAAVMQQQGLMHPASGAHPSAVRAPHFVRDLLSSWMSTFLFGVMMTGGGLFARYCWGRFIAGDIPPGHFIPIPHAQRTAIIDIKNKSTGEVTGHQLVSSTPVDDTAGSINKAVEAAANVGVAMATGHTPPTHPAPSSE